MSSGNSSELALTIGRKIAHQRKALGWTQDLLAERVGVDSETISRFERGRHLPSLPTLEKLAVAMNVSMLSFMPDQPAGVISEPEKMGTWMIGLSIEDREFALEAFRALCEHLRTK